MEKESQLVKVRRNKLDELREKGINPYAYSYDVKNHASEINEKYAKLKKEEQTKDKVSVAGRIMQLRSMGKIAFVHLQDQTGKVQLYFRENDLGKEKYKLLKKFDIGDIIGAKGKVFKTKKGEVTVYVDSFEILTKSLLPLPEKWHGLKDPELRYRQRYVDLIMNPEVNDVFIKRQMAFDAVREFLVKNGYKEVQTPILQPVYGGTNARPFVSKLNALDMRVYMRISNEMYLKRLIGGGYEKVFEFSPDFRNEGIDKLHNPEFTQVETMWAFASYKDNMKFWPKVVEFVAKKLHGKTKVKYQGTEIDFKAPWNELKFLDALKKYANADFSNVKGLEEAQAIARKLNVDIQKCRSAGEVMIAVFEELAQPKIIKPTLVYDYPKEAAILARAHEDKDFVKSFEIIINGWEIGLSYCEENDPEALAEKWKQQEKALAGGDMEAQKMDEDFINMLKIGMPPTSGMGIGMDRLVMLLTDQTSIRDVIFFPFMRPKEE